MNGRRFPTLLRLAVNGSAALLILLLAGFWAARWSGLGGGGRPYGFRALAFALVAFLFAGLDGWQRRGGRAAGLFLGLAVATSLGTELVGLATGRVFGRYVYAPEFGPKLAGLPVVVPLIWCSLSHLARSTAAAMTRRETAPPALSAALLVAWDLVADPNHLFRGGWRFLDGGFWAGVPLQNYVAWFLIGWGMFAVARRLERRARATPARGRDGGPAVALYLAILGHETLFAWRVAALDRVAVAGAVLVGVVVLGLLVARRGGD